MSLSNLSIKEVYKSTTDLDSFLKGNEGKTKDDDDKFSIVGFLPENYSYEKDDPKEPIDHFLLFLHDVAVKTSKYKNTEPLSCVLMQANPSIISQYKVTGTSDSSPTFCLYQGSTKISNGYNTPAKYTSAK